MLFFFFCFKQKTAYEMRISDWSSDVCSSDLIGVSFRRAFLQAGLKLAQCLIWRKDLMVMGRSDYQWIHEPILYGWKPGAAHQFYGGRKQVTVNDIGTNGSPFVRRPDGRWQITIGEETMVVAGASPVELFEQNTEKRR